MEALKTLEDARDQQILEKWSEALSSANVQKVNEIIKSHELRQISISYTDFLVNAEASQNDTIEILTQMGQSGFNLRKVVSLAGNGLLQMIVNRGHIDLYRHLWNH